MKQSHDKKKRCIIFASINVKKQIFDEINLTKDDLIIACDGGMNNCIKLNITPHIFIGDFDSFADKDKISVKTKIITLSKDKDDTDLIAGLKVALNQNFSDFIIFGAIGKRLDHTFANLQVLLFLKSQNANGIIKDEFCDIFLLTENELTLNLPIDTTLSIFAFGENECILSTKNLYWNLNNSKLTQNYPIGISNKTIDTNVSFLAHKGTALLIVNKVIDL